MRNIVVCCDGTGNEYGKEQHERRRDLRRSPRKKATQIAYYDPGVGTGGWAYDEESGVLRAFTDQGTGAGLQKNVNDAYRYLMKVYQGPEADRIFLFGFSRGAFTVRSLAGMLHKVGLLGRNADNHLEYAAKIYNRQRNASVAAGFKKTFSRAGSGSLHRRLGHGRIAGTTRGQALDQRPAEPGDRVRLPRPRHRRAAQGFPTLSLGRTEQAAGAGA